MIAVLVLAASTVAVLAEQYLGLPWWTVVALVAALVMAFGWLVVAEHLRQERDDADLENDWAQWLTSITDDVKAKTRRERKRRLQVERPRAAVRS